LKIALESAHKEHAFSSYFLIFFQAVFRKAGTFFADFGKKRQKLQLLVAIFVFT
jgi:hypothetical protein